MSVKTISVSDAVLKTATIEIKAISVSNKQMTLAVFKQIQKETVFDEKGHLKGRIWGTVNYCPNDCSGALLCDGGHTHFLWQKGDELRRDFAGKRPRLFGSEMSRTREEIELIAEWARRFEIVNAHSQIFIAV